MAEPLLGHPDERYSCRYCRGEIDLNRDKLPNANPDTILISVFIKCPHCQRTSDRWYVEDMPTHSHRSSTETANSNPQ